jgi:hypothetical protein
MKKKIAEKWVKALRSGKYKQGRHALKYKTKAGVTRHCCLGVLCELYQKEHKRKLKTEAERGTEELRDCKVMKFGDCNGTLPEKVMIWSGIGIDDGGLPDGRTLAQMNDHGDDFEDIAYVIESEYDGL